MSEQKGKVFILGSESIGRGDDDLGYEILMSMMKTLTEHKGQPLAIIFWNTAVRLLAEGSPTIPYLKILEEKGVQILAGQLCVNELGLTGKMSIGKMVGMNEILDLILNNDVVAL